MKWLWWIAAADQLLMFLVGAFQFTCWTDTYNWGSSAFMGVMIAATCLEAVLSVVGWTWPYWWPSADDGGSKVVRNYGGHHFLEFVGSGIVMLAAILWQSFFLKDLGAFPGFTGNEVQFIYFREANLLGNAFLLVYFSSFIALTPVHKTGDRLQFMAKKLKKFMARFEDQSPEVEYVSTSSNGKTSKKSKRFA